MARAALLRVTTAQPAEPLKPEMNSRRPSQAAMYSEEWLSSEGTTAGEVDGQQRVESAQGEVLTVDIHFIVSHKLSELREADGRVDLLHLSRGFTK